jgi:N-acetyl sugar amidotransferase
MIECKLCLMHTNITEVQLSKDGICNYCLDFKKKIPFYTFSPEEEKNNINQFVNSLKKRKNNSKYDAIIGLSGGADSSYLAYFAKELNLNILLVHMDNGWNSDISIKNINNVINNTGFDYESVILDWQEFKDLQRSFLKAGVIDIELITDHAITGSLVRIAKKYNINSLINGYNFRTEHAMPKTWSWYKTDLLNIKSIHKKFGSIKIKNYPFIPLVDSVMIHFGIGKLKLFRPLNLINYSRSEIINTLETKYNWIDYGGKHHESFFTKFYQGYILPKKFKVNKEISHLSCLIRNSEITKNQAKEIISKPIFFGNEIEIAKNYVIRKLDLNPHDFEKIMSENPRAHNEFFSQEKFYNLVNKIKNFYKKCS